MMAYFLGFLLLALLVGPFLVPVPLLKDTLPPEELAGPDSRFIEVNGLTVHYEEFGQGQPAIILLHGFGASTFSWREVTGPLSRLGRVIVYDRPAFGLTERPLPQEWQDPALQNPYSLQAQPDLLFGLLDALGIEQAILVGNSAGGTVAINAALARPERVQALVLVDAAVYQTGGSPAWLRWLLQTPQADRLGVLLARRFSSSGIDFLYRAWHDPSRVTPEIMDGYRKPLQAVHWDVALWQMTKASRSRDLSERLGELNMPVLVLTGDDDQIVPTENSLQLAKAIPAAQIVVFENCGHLPQEECPRAFLQAVEPFISQLSIQHPVPAAHPAGEFQVPPG